MELELRKVGARIHDSVRTSQTATKLYASGKTNEEVAFEIEQLYPYELNSQKPLSELLGGMPMDIGRWELEVGVSNRAAFIFNPTKRLLKTQLSELKVMRKESEENR